MERAKPVTEDNISDAASLVEAEKIPGSAVDQIIDSIQRLIDERALKVGDALPGEIELARLFGTSRNTVREAMRTLRAYGIVEARQKSGAVLIDNRHAAAMRLFSFGFRLSADIFTDIQDFRRLVEEGIQARVFENATPEDLDALEALTWKMEEASSISEAAEFDFAFHSHIVRLSNNKTTEDVYQIMRPVIQRLMESGKRERTQRRDIAAEHRSIIEAIRQRDRAAYTYWVGFHLKSGLKFIAKGGAEPEDDRRGA
ncbi:FCD domain-containing protein [Aquabacter sp. CN5-332]|uniref:FadR/GntR family transcriptional regulator n=1 Tax=Aquabacter sp. CN5-332 TaxID=3156608 RepID=UPI0032B513DE